METPLNNCKEMKGFWNIFLVTVILFSFGSSSFGQKPATPKILLVSGKNYIDNNALSKGAPYLEKYLKYKPKDQETIELLASVYLRLRKTEEAQVLLSNWSQLKKPDPILDYYYGAFHHLQYEFEKAAVYYKKYLADMDVEGDERKKVKEQIKMCVIGIRAQNKTKAAVVENLGVNVNTSYDDFAPVISPNHMEVLYFSSNRAGTLGGKRNRFGQVDSYGVFGTDMFVTRLSNGEWSYTEALDENHNSEENDIVLCFNQKGQRIYFFRGSPNKGGRLYFRDFKGDEGVEEPVNLPFEGIFDNNNWSGTVFSVHDSLMILSTNRLPGYGGSDLFYAVKKSNVWQDPVNLGPEVNSSNDEIAPFLSRDGRTLYFSSNGTNSMGGFDVFSVKFDDESMQWKGQTNLGFPINSPANDAYFYISSDGQRAFFSSDREEGFGGQDIYVAYYKKYIKEQQLFSTPYYFTEVEPKNEEDIQALDSIAKEKPLVTEQISFSPFFFNEEDKVITPSNIQKINNLLKFLERYPDAKIELIGNYPETGASNFDLYFSFKNAEAISNHLIKNGVSPARIVTKGQGTSFPLAKNKDDKGLPSLVGQRLNRRIDLRIYNLEESPVSVSYNYPDISPLLKTKEFENYSKKTKGLSYRVQFVSLRQRFDGTIPGEVPQIEKPATSDYLRYTVGFLYNYREAERLQKRLVEAGYKDAFIVPYINGQRLSKANAKLSVSSFPDLRNYLQNQ